MFVCIMLAVPTCISVVAGITMIYNYNLMHSDCMKDTAQTGLHSIYTCMQHYLLLYTINFSVEKKSMQPHPTLCE